MSRVLVLALAALLFACGGTAPSQTKPHTSPANLPNDVSPSSSTGNNPVPSPTTVPLPQAFGFNYNFYQSEDTLNTDLSQLKAAGVHALRLNIVDYDNPEEIEHWNGITQKALDLGFTVVYGLGGSPERPTLSVDRWNSVFVPAVLSEAKWANGKSNLWLEIGNEEHLHTPPGGPSPDQIRQQVRTLASQVKGLYPTLNLVYVDAGFPEDFEGWRKEGIGSLDGIGFNIYGPSHDNFADQLHKIHDYFGHQGFVAEWNTDGGSKDFEEGSWAAEIKARASLIQTIGVPLSFYYVYRDSEGYYGILDKSGSPRSVWSSLPKN